MLAAKAPGLWRFEERWLRFTAGENHTYAHSLGEKQAYAQSFGSWRARTAAVALSGLETDQSDVSVGGLELQALNSKRRVSACCTAFVVQSCTVLCRRVIEECLFHLPRWQRQQPQREHLVPKQAGTRWLLWGMMEHTDCLKAWKSWFSVPLSDRLRSAYVGQCSQEAVPSTVSRNCAQKINFVNTYQ